MKITIPIAIWILLVLILSVATIMFIRSRKKKKDNIISKLTEEEKRIEEAGKSDERKIKEVKTITRRYFRGEVWAVVIAAILFALSMWFIVEKVASLIQYKALQGEPETAEELILHHFDVTGIIIGIIGIIVGVLIYIVVENNNEQKSIDLNEQLDLLRDVNFEIKSYLSSLKLIDKLEDRLIAIKEVITHAQQNDKNNVYILNYAPNYGQLHIANLNIILTETDLKKREWKVINQKELSDYIIKLRRYEDENMAAIKSFINNGRKIKVAFLKSPCINDTYPDKYKNFIEERIIKDDENVVEVGMELNQPFADVAIKRIEEKKKENTFIHTVNGKPAENHLIKKEILIDQILSNDKSLFNYFKNSKTECNGLDYVPFQYFISIPENDNNIHAKCRGLIVFTNYYTIGQENSMVSFSTENLTLCKGLKEMFERLIKAQEDKDKNDNDEPIKIIFGTGTANKVKIILKNIDIKNVTSHPAFATHGEVTTVADSKTKDDLFDLFKNNEIEYTPNVKFIKEEEVDTFLMDQKEKNYTFLSVGLFFNPVSDRIGQDYNTKLINDNVVGRLFKLVPRDTTSEGTSVPKEVHIAKEIKKNGNEITIEYDEQPYVEVFSNEQSGNKGKFDYAIFSKEKINGKWIFICGGVNYFASQHIVKCLISNDWTNYKNKIRDREFISVFKVNKDETVELVLLKVVDNEIINKLHPSSNQNTPDITKSPTSLHLHAL